jgi:hypothetical protein
MTVMLASSHCDCLLSLTGSATVHALTGNWCDCLPTAHRALGPQRLCGSGADDGGAPERC